MRQAGIVSENSIKESQAAELAWNAKYYGENASPIADAIKHAGRDVVSSSLLYLVTARLTLSNSHSTPVQSLNLIARSNSSIRLSIIRMLPVQERHLFV